MKRRLHLVRARRATPDHAFVVRDEECELVLKPVEKDAELLGRRHRAGLGNFSGMTELEAGGEIQCHGVRLMGQARA